MSIWFNARVLCCEESPQWTAALQSARARVSWAPLGPAQAGNWRVLEGDWADPDYPYRVVEGHEVVLLRWPSQPCSSEQVRWWLSGAMHLAQSARRSRLRAFGFAYAPEAPPLLLTSGQFLSHYLESLEMRVCLGQPHNLLQAVEASLALA